MGERARRLECVLNTIGVRVVRGAKTQRMVRNLMGTKTGLSIGSCKLTNLSYSTTVPKWPLRTCGVY